MTAFMIVLSAVTITYSVFLIARFAIPKHENDDYVPADKDEEPKK